MATTWSGSDDSDERDESLDDEELMANFIAFASSHKSKGSSQEENDSSDDGSSSQSTNENVDKMDLRDYMVKFKSSRLKNKREIMRLKEENL